MLAMVSVSWLPWLLSMSILTATVAALRPIADATKCGEARVHITVSPRSRVLRVLELSWDYEDARHGDQVSLYDYDPVLRRPWTFPRHNITYSIPVVQGSGPDGLGHRGNAASPPAGGFPGGQNRPPGSQPPYDPYGGHGGAYPSPHADPYGSQNGQSGPYGSPNGPYDSQSGPYYGSQNQNGPYGGQYGPYGSSYGPGAGSGPGSAQYRPPGAMYPYEWGGGGGAPFPSGPRDAYGSRAPRQSQSEAEASSPQPSLQDGDVSGRTGRPPLVVLPTDGLRSGWRATNIQEQHVPSSQLGYKPRCLGYWAVYERPVGDGSNQSEVLAVTCLRTRPTWMWDFREEWMPQTLVDIMIPGTHDSAAYREDGRNNFLDKFTITQDESILGQLIYGVRYIDLRVGYYPNKDTMWWANHGVVRVQPLLSVMHDIKAFLGNTNEIVILDVQEFPAGFGKDKTIHHKLVHLLETELGELMIPRSDDGKSWNRRLKDIWDGGRRLIVGYDKEEILPASRKLWPSVRQFWGDVQTAEALTTYVTRLMEPQGPDSVQVYHPFPWAVMTELTPNAKLIATNPTWSLRRLASTVNRNVSVWAERSDWRFNVLAVDFVRSTRSVEAAIYKNLQSISVIPQCLAYQILSAVY